MAKNCRMSIDEVSWINLPHAADERGVLTSVEAGVDVPFEIRRIFYMHAIRAERGGHAHRDTRQVVLPVAGEFSVELSDGRNSANYRLADPNRGLYMPPMTWVRLYDFSAGAVCLVLADTHYDRSASLRSWEEFLAAVDREQPST
jgi:dTDP-4-dehydrorhamnose 3,5-epimerase-like enzyme